MSILTQGGARTGRIGSVLVDLYSWPSNGSTHITLTNAEVDPSYQRPSTLNATAAMLDAERNVSLAISIGD